MPICLHAAKLFSKSGVSDSEMVVCSLALKQPISGNVVDPDKQRTWHQEELGTFPLFPGSVSRVHDHHSLKSMFSLGACLASAGRFKIMWSSETSWDQTVLGVSPALFFPYLFWTSVFSPVKQR